jgi:hypothetical protein
MSEAFAARRIWTLLASGWQRQALVAEAFCSLLVARLNLALRPFSKVAGKWGPSGSRPADVPSPEADLRAPGLVRDIGWAVRSTATVVPFRALCLEQAIAARMMLSRRDVASTLHIGVARGDSSKLEAHAWVNAGDVRITGYPVSPNLVEIARYESGSPGSR